MQGDRLGDLGGEVQELAQLYKMIQGKEKLNKELFSHVDGGRTQQDADPLNLKQKLAGLEIRRNFFTQSGQKMACNTIRCKVGKTC
jgi:fumarate hydratase class II